jgi:hypothetical protein
MARRVPRDWDDDIQEGELYEEDIHRVRRRDLQAPVVRRARSRSRGPAEPAVNIAFYDEHHSRSPSRGRYHEDDINAAMRELRMQERDRERDRIERERLALERRELEARRDSRMPTTYDSYQDEMIRNVNWQLQEARRDKRDLEKEIERLAHDTRDNNRRPSEQDLQLVRMKSKIAQLQRQLEEEEQEEKIKEAEKMALIKRRDHDMKEEDEKKRIVEKWEADRKRKEEERKKLEEEAIARKEREEEKKKEADKAQRERWKLEELAEADKKKKEKEMWIAKIEEDKRAEEKKKKEEDERAKEKMRETLRKSGIPEKEIEKLVNPEKHSSHHHSHYEKTRITIKGSDAKGLKFIKVSKKYIEPETLHYYDLPWNYDEDDEDSIIIMKYIDKDDLDKLVKHTKRIRKKRAEEVEIGVQERRGRDGKKQIVMTRRRTPSRSPMGRKESPKRVSLSLFRTTFI